MQRAKRFVAETYPIDQKVNGMLYWGDIGAEYILRANVANMLECDSVRRYYCSRMLTAIRQGFPSALNFPMIGHPFLWGDHDGNDSKFLLARSCQMFVKEFRGSGAPGSLDNLLGATHPDTTRGSL